MLKCKVLPTSLVKRRPRTTMGVEGRLGDPPCRLVHCSGIRRFLRANSICICSSISSPEGPSQMFNSYNSRLHRESGSTRTGDAAHVFALWEVLQYILPVTAIKLTASGSAIRRGGRDIWSISAGGSHDTTVIVYFTAISLQNVQNQTTECRVCAFCF